MSNIDSNEDEDLGLFDDEASNSEPIERKPRLSLGVHDVTVTGTSYSDGFSGKYFIVEGTKDADGSEWAQLFKLDVSKKAKPYAERRVREFMNPALGRKNIPNGEVVALIRGDGSAFAGAKLTTTVTEQTDDEGEVVRNEETGEAYTDIRWAARKS